MSRGFISVIVLLFIMSLTMLPSATVKAQSKTIVVPDNYPTIQAAIDNANAGDTVFVRSGSYDQNVSIGKSINLIGENAQTTILTMPQLYTNPAFPGAPATYIISINANGVNVDNFTINNPNVWGSGIGSNGNRNQIIGLKIDSIWSGIVVNGAYQYISQNHIANALTGIQCGGSYNQIIGNTFSNTGVTLSGSYNSIAGNFISYGEGMPISLENANTNLIYNNTVTKGSIYLENSNSNIICYNSISGGGSLLLGDAINRPASNNLVSENTIEGAVDWGILMGYGSYNVFYGNLVANNGGYGHDGYGLAIGGIDILVSNNLFYYNVFINNTKNFGTNWQVIGSNSFDNGTVGNYWDDDSTKYPNVTETDNSGVENVPYLVYGNVTDNYPLMAPFDISSINIQLPAWINSLPTPVPMPFFPSQNPVNSQTNPTSSPSPIPSASLTPSPSIPEFLSWTIPLLLILMLATAGLLVYHKKHKRSLVKKDLLSDRIRLNN
jgi:nitrous oxidase accessory protein